MLSLLIALSLAPSATAGLTEVDLLLTKAKQAQARGTEQFKAGNDAGVKAEMCEAHFYYSKLLAKAETPEAVRGAFNTAYYADLAKTALELYPRLASPTEGEQGRKADLDQKPPAELVDSECAPHAAACGDAIVDTNEACDDGNTLAGDGCNAVCAADPASAATSAPTSTPANTNGAVPPAATPAASGSPLPFVAGAVGAVGVVTAIGGIIVGAYQNGQMNAEDPTGGSSFLLEPDDRKAAEGTRDIAYVVGAIAGVVGVVGIGAAALTWE